MKSLSLLTLVLAAALAGCDAGIAGSSESSPSSSNGPAVCPTMGGQRGACKVSGAAAQTGACPSQSVANPNCPQGRCDFPGQCGKPECEPKACEEMQKDCPKQKCEPKVND
jgi:hypothetical protein